MTVLVRIGCAENSLGAFQGRPRYRYSCDAGRSGVRIGGGGSGRNGRPRFELPSCPPTTATRHDMIRHDIWAAPHQSSITSNNDHYKKIKKYDKERETS